MHSPYCEKPTLSITVCHRCSRVFLDSHPDWVCRLLYSESGPFKIDALELERYRSEMMRNHNAGCASPTMACNWLVQVSNAVKESA